MYKKPSFHVRCVPVLGMLRVPVCIGVSMCWYAVIGVGEEKPRDGKTHARHLCIDFMKASCEKRTNGIFHVHDLIFSPILCSVFQNTSSRSAKNTKNGRKLGRNLVFDSSSQSFPSRTRRKGFISLPNRVLVLFAKKKKAFRQVTRGGLY